MNRQFRPWEQPNIACIRCDQQATRHGWGSGEFGSWASDHKPLIIGDGPIDSTEFYGCATHTDEMQDDLCQRFGMSNSEPLIASWGYYLLRQAPGLRLVGSLQTKVSNWRYDRSER